MENRAFFDDYGTEPDYGVPKTPYRQPYPFDYTADYQYRQMMLQGSPILIPRPYGQEREELKDMEYWKSMYPSSVRRLQAIVDEECDKMDYQGSPIYDEYPDHLMVRRLCRGITDRAAEDEAVAAAWGEESEMDSAAVCRNRRLCDLVELLVINELYKRRARKRCCGRRYF